MKEFIDPFSVVEEGFLCNAKKPDWVGMNVLNLIFWPRYFTWWSIQKIFLDLSSRFLRGQNHEVVWADKLHHLWFELDMSFISIQTRADAWSIKF